MAIFISPVYSIAIFTHAKPSTYFPMWAKRDEIIWDPRLGHVVSEILLYQTLTYRGSSVLHLPISDEVSLAEHLECLRAQKHSWLWPKWKDICIHHLLLPLRKCICWKSYSFVILVRFGWNLNKHVQPGATAWLSFLKLRKNKENFSGTCIYYLLH